MKSARDATRRNRNIGTSKRGIGQNNRLTISICDPDAVCHYESLTAYTSTQRELHGRHITFIVERTRVDSYHACTVDDITRMLGYIPPDDLVGIDLVVLRQAKRKEQILNSVWGRLAFYVEIGEHHGRAIFIESIDLKKPMRWSKSLNPDAADELDRLIRDGHDVTTDKRRHIVSSSIEAVRSTQLYRTLLHEVGHHVDYSRNQIGFDKKISREREVFAHRYADELRERLEQKKVIPFERILESRILERDGLDMSDFTAI